MELHELGPTIRAVAERLGPAVVRIGSHGGRGCGLVVEAGVVLTNAHNLRGPETRVTFADGRQATGTVAGVDVDCDLAAIEVDTGEAAPVEWRDEPPELGEAVVAVSRSAGGGARASFGTISGTERAFRGPRGRRITGSLEHTAPLARGSSGSPLADPRGRVVGMNINRLGDGFYLALPAGGELRERLAALRDGRAPQRPRLGVGLAPPAVARRLRQSVGLPERDGLLVRAVEEGSPADAAGIRPGDLIVTAGGVDVTEADALYEVLDRAGATLEVHLVRGADELDVEVRFAD